MLWNWPDMSSLAFVYGLASVAAVGLFIYLGYVLLRPEEF